MLVNSGSSELDLRCSIADQVTALLCGAGLDVLQAQLSPRLRQMLKQAQDGQLAEAAAELAHDNVPEIPAELRPGALQGDVHGEPCEAVSSSSSSHFRRSVSRKSAWEASDEEDEVGEEGDSAALASPRTRAAAIAAAGGAAAARALAGAVAAAGGDGKLSEGKAASSRTAAAGVVSIGEAAVVTCGSTAATAGASSGVIAGFASAKEESHQLGFQQPFKFTEELEAPVAAEQVSNTMTSSSSRSSNTSGKVIVQMTVTIPVCHYHVVFYQHRGICTSVLPLFPRGTSAL
jgi:hypothetical protein